MSLPPVPLSTDVERGNEVALVVSPLPKGEGIKGVTTGRERRVCLQNIGRALAFIAPQPRERFVVSGTHKATLYRWDDLPREQLNERLSRRLATGDRPRLRHVYLRQWCAVPRHSHENEQLTYSLEGGRRFLVGADGAGESGGRAGEVLH